MKTIFAFLRQNRLRMCEIAGAFTMVASSLAAQAPVPRITSEITSAATAPLKGSQHPLAQAQSDAGRMPADTRLTGMSLVFSRSPAQQADLQALIVAQQTPTSPLYHQWLTPGQFAARFGTADSDIEQVQSWLERQGFAIDSVSRSRTAIRFSGTAGQVESAFSTQMHYYSVNGEKHFAPSTSLSVPAAMASSVQTIRNLNDFKPKAQHITPSQVSVRPGFTSSQSGNVFFAPGDIATVYDIKPLYSASETGSGQTIAVMGQSSVVVGDIEAFESAAGLTKKDPTLVLVPGTGDPAVVTGDESESDLDLEWSGAIATGANIVFVYTGNSSNNGGVFDSMSYAVDEDIAPIISVSYGACETQFTATDIASYEAVGAQATTQGQTIIAASGDQGSTSCSGTTGLTTVQQEALAVNYPASSAYATAMGGTEISSANDVVGTYWSAATNSTTDAISSATQYIPEVAWNDDSSANGLSASGGGTSTLIAKPSWQTGVTGIASGNFRLVPDLALYSSPNYPGYLYCTSDTSAWNTSQQASCNSGFRDSASLDLTVAGGTSFAAPIFAGMLAIINQKAGYVTGQGLVNSTLYTLAANSTNYSSAFHDIITGNNYCTAGSTYCASNGSTLGFKAGTGYDEVTGLGSVDLNNLATVWPTNTSASATLLGTTTTVTPSNAAPSVNVADTFTITIASDSGTTVPTGTVTLDIDGGTSLGGSTVAAQSLSANGTLTYSATFTTTGTHQVLAKYSGDTTHAASVGVGSVTIAATSSGKGTFALAATAVTVAQGTSGSSTITVTPAGGYTGTVLLTFASNNDSALANLCYSFSNELTNGDGSVAVSGTSAVSTQLTLDTNASDCSTSGAQTKTGKRPFRMLPKYAPRLNRHAALKSTKNSSTPVMVAIAGLLLSGFLGRYSRKLRPLAAVIALVAFAIVVSACGGGGGNSSQSAATATPTFSVTPGTYTTAQLVTISDSTPGANIYYTTTGTTPTSASTAYAAPIKVSSTETIEAIAIASGDATSAVASALYTIAPPPTTATPTFSPAPGTYNSTQSVTISDTTSGAVIYYTTDGSVPTTTSQLYSAPIQVSSTETIQAIAAASGDTNSPVASATYTITPTNPPKGTYTVTVTGQDSTSSSITANTTFQFVIN